MLGDDGEDDDDELWSSLTLTMTVSVVERGDEATDDTLVHGDGSRWRW